MDLEETRAFLAVVDNGSFKAAAETVKQPRATLRRRVEALEARAGVPLLERSRTGVVPTAAGELLARQGRVMLRETTTLLSALRELGDEPGGEICVGVPRGVPSKGLAIVVSEFQTRFPRTQLRLRVCDDPSAELANCVDVALSFGDDIPNGRWQRHRLLSVNETLKASRDYLQRHGIPQSLGELEGHKLLTRDSGEAPRWPSSGGGSFAVEATTKTTDPRLLEELVRLGCGIGLLPDHLEEDEGQEPLIPLLEGVVGGKRELYLIVPEVAADTPKIRALVEHLLDSGDVLYEQLVDEIGPTAGAGLQGLHSPAI